MVDLKFSCADTPSDELLVTDYDLSDRLLVFETLVDNAVAPIVLSYADVETLASTLQDWLIENKKDC
jgi:hypothetical protein